MPTYITLCYIGLRCLTIEETKMIKKIMNLSKEGEEQKLKNKSIKSVP